MRFLRWAAAAVPLALAIHCGGDESGEGPTVDGGPDAPTTPTPDAAADAVDPSPYGFDTRPANRTCLAPKRPAARNGLGVKLQRVFANVAIPGSPVGLVKRPSVPRWYVTDKTGRILTFDDVPTVTDFGVALDLRSKVYNDALESGLLGFAFHPKFAQNGYAYVYYAHDGLTATEGVRLARYTSTDGGVTFDPASEKVILDVRRNVQNHLGGQVLFGPDGYLYLGLGDGNSLGTVQSVSGTCDATGCGVFAGKMLRLDVDGGDPYAIPATNPFAKGGGRPEIFALGLRNPWRFSFDRGNGDLWVGDVGELSREEIDIVRAGGNYGWPLVEGTLCAAPPCSPELVPPIYELAHPESHSLTGGFVYRGSALPQLQGAYVFGDFATLKVWALVTDPLTGARKHIVVNDAATPIYAASFAETDTGEVIVVDFGTNGFYQVVADGPVPAGPTLPEKLSQTGCVEAADPTRPAAGVVPYAINVPFWSDDTEKDRWFAIPDGTTIGVKADGDLDLPVGGVTMKTFRLGQKRIETRLFVRHDDGDWGGYTYEWNDAGTDATLVADAKVKRVGDRDWELPSRLDCMRCHTTAAGRTLGLEIAQLDRKADYPNRPARDQLETLVHARYFATPPAKGTPLPPLEGPAPLESRARAYLHANCAMCHRPDGATPSAMDLRFAAPLAATKTCDVVPERGTMGIAGARLLAPGDPEKSLIVRRPRALDVWRMPPLVSRAVDTDGTALLATWIAGRRDCL